MTAIRQENIKRVLSHFTPEEQGTLRTMATMREGGFKC